MNYSLKAFLTITPYPTLKQYFKGNHLPDYQWPKEPDIESLAEVILRCPDAKKIGYDFRTIHQWANERGIDMLIEEARSPIHNGLEIGEELGRLENDHDRAMAVFLKYPEVLRWAMEIQRLEYLKGKKHHYVGTGLDCDGDDEEIRKRLGEIIATYYKRQGKGKHCEVFYYKQHNPVRHYFFAYPEDNVKGYLAYDEKGKIGRQAYQPAFEVIFEYNENDGDLAVHVKGKLAQTRMLTEFCKTVLGFKELPNTETEVFDLHCLKDPEYHFKKDASMPVDSITLKMVILELPGGANRKVTLEAGPYKGDHRQVEAMIAQTMKAHGVKPEETYVRKAKIEIKFKTINLNKIGQITFIVGDPQYSTLADDEKSEMAKKYLKIWGMVRKHKPKGKKDAS